MGMTQPPDQRRAPLLAALRAYSRRRPAVFHIPGHKRGRGAPRALVRLLGPGTLAADLTEAPGLDDLHAPEGAIAEAQRLAAAAFGAAHTHFLVGGTTAGLQALLLAACAPGDTVLVPRHAHRSILGGLILSGARPVYLRPDYEKGLDLPLGIPPARLAAALQEHPSARAAVLIHPTYHGLAGHIEELISICRRAGVPALVDSAHGAHFRFHPGLPGDPVAAGADGVVHSVHKTGGSMTQSSLLHLPSRSQLDPIRVAEMLRLVQSTSPSYVLMASLDAARRELALRGAAAWGEALAMAQAAREQLARVPGVAVPAPAAIRGEAVAALDLTRLVIDVRGRGITGFAAREYLWQQHGVAVELAGQGYVLALVGPADTSRSIGRLVAAVAGLPWAPAAAAAGAPASLGEPPWPDVVLTPRDAFLGPSTAVPLAAAQGRIAAELVAPYPPGIPVVAPGERITPEVALFLQLCVATGQHLQGPADPALGTIQVVAE